VAEPTVSSYHRHDIPHWALSHSSIKISCT